MTHPTKAHAVCANFYFTQDSEGIVWLHLLGRGTTGAAAFNLGSKDRIAGQVALLLEADRLAAMEEATPAPTDDEIAQFSAVHQAAGYGLPVRSNNPNHQFLFSRDQDRFDGWRLAQRAAQTPQAAPAPAPADEEPDTSKPTSRDDLSRVLREWNDTTGAIPVLEQAGDKSIYGSWFYEVLGMMEDAYDLGAKQQQGDVILLGTGINDGTLYVTAQRWRDKQMQVIGQVEMPMDAVKQGYALTKIHGPDLTARGQAWADADTLIHECAEQAGLQRSRYANPVSINLLHRIAQAAHKRGWTEALQRAGVRGADE